MDKYELIDAYLALVAGDRIPAMKLVNRYYKDYNLKQFGGFYGVDPPSGWALYHIIQSFGYDEEKGLMFDRPEEL